MSKDDLREVQRMTNAERERAIQLLKYLCVCE